MEAAYPSEDSPASLEGHAAHLVAQMMIEHDTVLPVGSVLDGNVEVTTEMVEAARLYVDDIASELGASWRQHVLVEKPVSLQGLHPEAFGTPDLVGQFPRFLFLWDFKYGHRYVDAFENWQLIGYAFAYIEAMTAEEEMQTEVVFTIVQPRNFHPDGPVRRWKVKAFELRGYFNQLKGWLAEAMAPNVVASPTPSACQDCSARVKCVALRNAAYTGMDLAQASQAHALDTVQLGAELTRVQDLGALLESYQSGLEEEAEGAIRRGVSVPGFTMAQGRASLEWNVPDDMVASIVGTPETQPTNPLYAPLKLLTPTQARDRKLIPPEMVEAFTHRPGGKLKLSRVDHKLAKKVFGK
jgi:hypothetical protein